MMKKPSKAKGKRRQITTKHQPGGPQTPGAKATQKRKVKRKR